MSIGAALSPPAIVLILAVATNKKQITNNDMSAHAFHTHTNTHTHTHTHNHKLME
jgi:hypothetical protein